MSERTLKRLLGALGGAALIWLVVFLTANREGDTPAEVTGEIATFFEGVSDSTVTAVTFSRLGASIELRPDGERWRVNGFRADSGSVTRLFEALASAEVVSLAASNPANHARMGVAADSTATLTLEVDGAPRTLLVGLDGPRASTVYARLPDEDPVYLIEGGIRPHVYRQLDDWRNRQMLAIDTSQVRRITVQRDGRSADLVRGDSTWAFATGGAANQLMVKSILDQLGGGLVASRFVAADDSLASLPLGGTTTAFGASGEQLAQVTVGRGTGDRWGMAAGDSVMYRLPSFRIDLIVPTVESLGR